jgi:beta-lactamase class A
MHRRDFLLAIAAAPACLGNSAWAAASRPAISIGRLEEQVGGRIGVFVLDTSTGATLEHRADERFAMCSTFKWILAAQLLASIDLGICSLQDVVTYGRDDLLDYAPTTKAHVELGRLSLEELARAAVVVSDNTAANLLLRKLGGPEAFTAFARTLGDATTRLDRYEPDLNSNIKDDQRDTTTPRGMVNALRSALVGSVLSPGSRDKLTSWLVACETGRDRLRAGMPRSWKVGDKTGSGANMAVNDVAIATPPGRGPIFLASYMSESASSLQMLNSAHADLARAVSLAFG